jgi:hypothetical protein
VIETISTNLTWRSLSRSSSPLTSQRTPRYSRLMEDLHDLAIVAERRNEKPITAEDMKKRLRKRGLL